MTEIEIIHEQIEILHRKITNIEECFNMLRKLLDIQGLRIDKTSEFQNNKIKKLEDLILNKK
jgi:hypothetical protein